MAVLTRFKNLFNAFASAELERPHIGGPVGSMYSSSTPHVARPRFYNDKSIITSIYTRIAIDVAAIEVRHIMLDKENRYSDDIDSFLNKCFTFQANMDQGPRSFRQNLVTVLFDHGVAAVVAVDMISKDDKPNRFDVMTMRVGEITAWYPKHVRVRLYNEDKGESQELLLEKRNVAIVYNPLAAVMNEPSSTLQRLTRKLHLLDAVDEASSSGKLDIIIQLPYVVKSDLQKQRAEQRREDIEFQLKGSKYGIAYADGTEKITQLNRPAENNLLGQIEYLTKLLFGQLGITDEVMNGTADEKTMNNYWNRTIEPILDSAMEAFQMAWLGIEGFEDKERIQYFRNPFKLIPVANLADIADKFARNEVFSSNEIRGFMGVRPSKDPKADELRNSNMPQPGLAPGAPVEPEGLQYNPDGTPIFPVYPE